jgi:hypothetical protein
MASATFACTSAMLASVRTVIHHRAIASKATHIVHAAHMVAITDGETRLQNRLLMGTAAASADAGGGVFLIIASGSDSGDDDDAGVGVRRRGSIRTPGESSPHPESSSSEDDSEGGGSAVCANAARGEVKLWFANSAHSAC